MLMSVDLTSIGLDKNTNPFLSQNLSDCNDKIAFHCWELKRKRLWDSMRVSGGKVFIKIQDNTNKEEIKHLSDNHLREKLTVLTCLMFLQKEPSQMFDIGENSPLLYFLWQLYPIQKQFSRGGLRIYTMNDAHLTTLKPASFSWNASWWLLLPTIVALCVIIALHLRLCYY